MTKSSAGFFARYRDAILFNKNLIISGAAGFFASAYTSQLYSSYDGDALANSAVALATEYAVYLPLFAALYYLDNKQKYVDPATGRKNTEQIRGDIKKLFASFSVSEIVFSVIRLMSQYEILRLGTDPYAASMISSIIAWATFFLAINLMAKLVKLFRKS
ncbi:MAG: hypothetical protein ACREAQ_07285 [Nitrososphaera sp.]